jgi:hypothetical protein
MFSCSPIQGPARRTPLGRERGKRQEEFGQGVRRGEFFY